jgi:hypothetical protein
VVAVDKKNLVCSLDVLEGPDNSLELSDPHKQFSNSDGLLSPAIKIIKSVVKLLNAFIIFQGKQIGLYLGDAKPPAKKCPHVPSLNHGSEAAQFAYWG